MAERELVLAANANFVASFAKLAEHSAAGEVRDFDGIFAFVSGHPVSLFNGCVVPRAAAPAALQAAVGWVRERPVPFRVWIDPSLAGELGEVAQGAGLERDPIPYPNMVLHPLSESQQFSPSVTVAPPVGTSSSTRQSSSGSLASSPRRSSRRDWRTIPTSDCSSAGSAAGRSAIRSPSGAAM